MTEKLLFCLFGLLTTALGYFIKQYLDEIRDTQKTQGKMLYGLSEKVTRIETKVENVSGAVQTLQKGFEYVQQTSRETKSVLDHNLYEMRQDFKKMQDEQYEQKANYGKVIVILQKLFAKANGGG